MPETARVLPCCPILTIRHRSAVPSSRLSAGETDCVTQDFGGPASSPGGDGSANRYREVAERRRRQPK